MSWVRLDDQMPTHPKIAGLSDRAFRAHVEALCYAASHLTDGHITTATLKRISTPKARVELVKAGVWDETGDGVTIHDYADFQPSRGEVLERREATRKRIQAWRRNQRA